MTADIDLVRAKRTLKANLRALRTSPSTVVPTSEQIAAASAVENIIVTATKQQVGWAWLILEALRELGEFLLRTPYLKGRPPKVSTVDTLPSLKKLGVKDRRIAWRAIQVARIDRHVFDAYLAATDMPTEKGLLRFAEAPTTEENQQNSWCSIEDQSRVGTTRRFSSASDNKHPALSATNEETQRYSWRFPSANGKKHLALQATTANEEWYTPSAIFEALGCRFDLDPASPGADVVPWIPADRHFTVSDNGLERDWGDAFVWLNPPYGRETLPQWLAKFRDHANGIALVVDRTSTQWWQNLCGNADLVLQLNKKIQFLRPDDGSEPGNNALGSSLVAYGERAVKALRNATAAGLGTLFKPCQPVPESSHTDRLSSAPSADAHEIVEWLMADRDKAAEVWRGLGARLVSSEFSGSSLATPMLALFLSGHGIKSPR